MLKQPTQTSQAYTTITVHFVSEGQNTIAVKYKEAIIPITDTLDEHLPVSKVLYLELSHKLAHNIRPGIQVIQINCLQRWLV